MKLLNFLKKQKEELNKSMFNIDEEVLALFGMYIREYQRKALSYKDIKNAFMIYGYEIVNCSDNYVLIKDKNGNLREIVYNEQLIEIMAFYGDKEAKKCMDAILDWKMTFGYEIPKHWKNVNNEWHCQIKKFKNHTIKI